MTTFEKAKAFGQGFLARASLAEYLKDGDPAKVLLVWIRTAVDNFLDDPEGPQKAVEGWNVVSGWIKKHREQPDHDLTRPAEQVLQRITTHAEERLRQNDRSQSVTELRIVEPWIEAFFTHEEIA